MSLRPDNDKAAGRWPSADASWFRDKRVTVMGLGIHGGGVGIAKWLRRHGAIVTATDLRDQHALASSLEELERTYLEEVRAIGKRRMHRIRYVLGSHPEELFTDADMVIRNPAVPRAHRLLTLARRSGVPVESDISIFFLLCPFPIAAISGTKGKTTTTALLAAMCREADRRTVVGGNIRISPLDKLDRLLALAAKRTSPPPIVLELSSWQLESLEPHRLSPHVGVLTTIVEDHLDRYEGMDDYARAKEIIVAYQGRDDIAVLNADNPRTAAIGTWHGQIAGAPNAGRRLWFSAKPLRSGDGCWIAGGKILIREGGTRTVVAPVSAIKLPGEHNRGNALAAIAAARAMGVPLAAVRKALRAFRGVPYRLEDLGVKRGARFVNDTAATAPDASVAAMAAYAGKGRKRIVLIAGGADKNLRFDEWAKAVKRTVKHLVLFDGSATPKMEAALSAAGAMTPRAGARSMREAFAEAVRHAKRGDVVLLSPGCASFGIFKNEFDRGDQFSALAKKLR
ncbi:MAG TPA: UDP-N-acetylmuramoyl-L-alanine--D-glutamate ligase [Candidatus Binatia bacterium]|jgi:UDP-N-acetylmuramoylalanine--D-glutamate ligase|nr:UDP-N-acetylmuramoyl-L-alanine--D-glutamate ligase [Candidatus Binatia bacterium]